MERGGVLAAVRRSERPVVCEIGAGWGGFAYQFKTLVPRSTYVIVDFPELFLFSATYLARLFPDARLAFVGAARVADHGAAMPDFVFVPQTAGERETIGSPDLVVNMVSFQEMTDAQVVTTRRWRRAGCPLIYSFNRERSPTTPSSSAVSEALADRYRLTEVPC
jgi:hypothetical protein